MDLLAGRKTRDHGDIDVGVFRSQLPQCLAEIGRETVYLCDPPGTVRKWDGDAIPGHVNDLWISSSDRAHWEMQILVFTDDETHVYFKRDHSIRWPKTAHALKCENYHILNPAITILYKSHQAKIEAKDAHDISLLIDMFAGAGSLSQTVPPGCGPRGR